VEASGGDRVAVIACVSNERLPDFPEAFGRPVDPLDRRRLSLDDALEQLVIEAPLEYFRGLGLVDEFVGPARGACPVVDDEKLLLDTDRTHPVERRRRSRVRVHRGSVQPGPV